METKAFELLLTAVLEEETGWRQKQAQDLCRPVPDTLNHDLFIMTSTCSQCESKTTLETPLQAEHPCVVSKNPFW